MAIGIQRAVTRRAAIGAVERKGEESGSVSSKQNLGTRKGAIVTQDSDVKGWIHFLSGETREGPHRREEGQKTGSRRQQPKPEAFPGQPRDIVSPACPGPSPGSGLLPVGHPWNLPEGGIQEATDTDARATSTDAS
ncbi:hypothetical protein CRENBAI_008174 [Crenichthys baileyi]|uniref:Uncharacterized protein n=1 Tax=Crenichthys baileyi TaxID=28760 RepID=A0AAV9RGC5_9TELE